MAQEEQKNIEETEAEERKIRRTISAEETFTLAKDVFDIRCFFKNIYSNRAVIARRLNIFSLICSLLFTMLYTAYNVWVIVTGRLSLGLEIAIYCLLGVYVIFAVCLVITTLCAEKANTKTVKRYKKTLKIFRFCVRIVSLAMAIIAIAATSSGGGSAAETAFSIVLIVFSVLCIIIQSIPLIFGGFANLARWAVSPAKGKARFSAVLVEWYELVLSGNADQPYTKKISKKYIEDIGKCIDGFLIPRLGKRRITDIDAQTIYDATFSYPEEGREIIEGVFKNVFGYAEDCGYVNLNPTRNMELEGSIEEPSKKPRRTVKSRLLGLGKRIGKSVIKSVLKDDEDS